MFSYRRRIALKTVVPSTRHNVKTIIMKITITIMLITTTVTAVRAYTVEQQLEETETRVHGRTNNSAAASPRGEAVGKCARAAYIT